jgi:hypothetical protein
LIFRRDFTKVSQPNKSHSGEIMQKVPSKIFSTLCLGILLFALASCADEHKLVGIDVSPQNFTITGQGLNVQFTAIGHYQHPLQDKDITGTVVWKSTADQIISFSSTQPGLATSGGGCGTNLQVSANVYSNPKDPANGSVIQGVATVNVKQPNDPNCS